MGESDAMLAKFLGRNVSLICTYLLNTAMRIRFEDRRAMSPDGGNILQGPLLSNYGLLVGR